MNTQITVPVEVNTRLNTRQLIARYIKNIQAERVAAGAGVTAVLAYTLGYIQSELCWALDEMAPEKRGKFLNRIINIIDFDNIGRINLNPPGGEENQPVAAMVTT